MDGLTFTCPVCGGEVPRRAKACPDCGACEKSGWSQDPYLDGLNLPDDEFDYDNFTRREFGRGSPKKTKVQWFWWAVTVLVLVALAWVTLQGMFR